MTLDGIAVKSSSNTFTSAVTGLTLTAVKLGTSNVTVQNDSTKITSAVQAFVDSYNAVVSLIKSNNGYNASTNTGQAFTGDTAARSVIDNLGRTRTTVPTELAGATMNSLSALGITIQQTGLLKLDTATLSTAVNTSAKDVVSALTAYGKSFSTEVTAMLSSDGTVANRLSSLDSSVRRYKDSQASLEVRVSLVEKRYRAQFTALDKLVSSMQTTSSYLTQQISQLQK